MLLEGLMHIKCECSHLMPSQMFKATMKYTELFRMNDRCLYSPFYVGEEIKSGHLGLIATVLFPLPSSVSN